MRKCKITSYGYALPKTIYNISGQFRRRIQEEESQLSLMLEASHSALQKGNISIQELDCIVAASAVALQPIPCSAALLHEKLAPALDIPALDINTTCTSFLTALDLMSYLLDAKRYRRILIVAGDVASLALNPKQKESYELFADGAVAFVLEATDEEKGILNSLQKTWSEGAHATEIRGGLSSYHPKYYAETTKEEYMFDMKGKQVLSISLQKLPGMLEEFLSSSTLKRENIDMLIPHQASLAMPLMMQKLGFPEEKYINIVKDYGNMVSASTPFALIWALEQRKVKEGDLLLLLGTAAGLTTNMLLWRL